MSAVPSVENPPPPPPRSRARRAPRAPKDGSDEGEEFEDASEFSALQRTLAERDERIAKLEADLENVTSSRDDMVERSSEWLQEREELRAQNQELAEQLQTERERADAAEERVRELRRTAEESRRAIMRLSSSKARSDAQRSELDQERTGRRPSTGLNSLTSRALSSLSFDGDAGEETRGLKGLRLSSGSSVTSPTPPAADTFGTPKDDASQRESATPAETPELPQGEADAKPEEGEPAEPTGDDAGANAPNAFTAMFNKSSLLRPTFSLLRKPAPGAEAPTESEEHTPEPISRADFEKAHAELAELRTQLVLLQDQLTESREAEQASEQCIRSLREYIVNSQGAGERDGALLAEDAGGADVSEVGPSEVAAAAPVAEAVEPAAEPDVAPAAAPDAPEEKAELAEPVRETNE
ncbi:hypothetical protein MOBT1_001949 [Malassezia obtusa]|uniref:Uncharacterized protein n=1 Tax=Malassezia obtusa TaxID=76774 RepID=A0AAF0IS56_9BASI|nr:hypothetical protein MOBT1_001949 [Malassezia obtusa]